MDLRSSAACCFLSVGRDGPRSPDRGLSALAERLPVSLSFAGRRHFFRLNPNLSEQVDQIARVLLGACGHFDDLIGQPYEGAVVCRINVAFPIVRKQKENELLACDDIVPGREEMAWSIQEP